MNLSNVRLYIIVTCLCLPYSAFLSLFFHCVCTVRATTTPKPHSFYVRTPTWPLKLILINLLSLLCVFVYAGEKQDGAKREPRPHSANLWDAQKPPNRLVHAHLHSNAQMCWDAKWLNEVVLLQHIVRDIEWPFGERKEQFFWHSGSDLFDFFLPLS